MLESECWNQKGRISGPPQRQWIGAYKYSFQVFELQVHRLNVALEALLDPKKHPEALTTLGWPDSVQATVNFSQHATGPRGRLRLADHVALLPDCSLLLISPREFEYLLRAARRLRQQALSMSASVTNLTYLRWQHPVRRIMRAQQPACSSAAVPAHAIGKFIQVESEGNREKHSGNVVAAQLFNGETDYQHQGSEAVDVAGDEAQRLREQDTRRKESVAAVLFPKARETRGDLVLSLIHI